MNPLQFGVRTYCRFKEKNVMRRTHLLLWLLIGLLLVTGIRGDSLAQEVTPSPTPEVPPRVITIWWPDTLATPDNEAARAVLDAQTADFVAAHDNVEVQIRLKTTEGAGSIMSTLRTASGVAPTALPTLTLVQRRDLVSARRLNLIQSLEGDVPLDVEDDLDTALQLGQINGELFGAPYLLEMSHLVYRPDNGRNQTDWTFDAVLQRGEPFMFPAGRTTGLSEVFLLQYLAAGGTLSEAGTLTLNQEALQTTLEFYEAASDAGLINGFALNYTQPQDYLQAFNAEEFDVAVFSSSAYLQLHETDERLRIAPIPSATGQPAAVLDGWMWILIPSEVEQHNLGARYINWMLDAERQAAYARQVYRVPSRTAAIQRGLVSNADVDAYLQLLDNPVLPISESDGGTLARSMQEALSSVLTKEHTADDATQRVINQLPDDESQ
jgi:ABC-type glycerol-3-phosphate transport system substrate-binding protein